MEPPLYEHLLVQYTNVNTENNMQNTMNPGGICGKQARPNSVLPRPPLRHLTNHDFLIFGPLHLVPLSSVNARDTR